MTTAPNNALGLRMMKLLEPPETARRRRVPAYRIRVFDPKGHYPNGPFASPDALYHASPELVYSVVLGKPHDQSADVPYSEMDWVTPQELRFWSSILLCEDTEGRKILLYPHFNGYILDSAPVDLRDPHVQSHITHLLGEEAKRPRRPQWGGDIRDCWNAGYSIFSDEYHGARQPAFYDAITTDDHVLLRGLACLIKCDMLSRHHEFAEEATLVAFIAMDASYSLIADRLKAEGQANPTAKDVGRWLDDTFNRPIGLEVEDRAYFEEMYQQRVMTMHPSSRFGASLYAPVMFEDHMMIRRDLREIFAYIVLGRHGPEQARRLRGLGAPSGTPADGELRR